MMMSAPFNFLEVKSHFEKKNDKASARQIQERPYRAEQERQSRTRLNIR